MALQYLIEYRNLREEDIRVEIHSDTYSGSVVELDSVQGGAIKFSYEGDDDPILSHVVHKSLELSVYSSGLDLDDLMSSNDGDKTVKYFKNGSLKFHGFLLSEGINDKETGISFEVALKAVDGFSILEESGKVIDYETYYGRISVNGNLSAYTCPMNLFRRVLNSGQYGMIPLPIRWSSSISSAQGIAGDFLAGNIELDNFRRLTRGRGIDAYWLIEEMCKGFNLSIEQIDGYWYIYSKKDLIQNSGVLDFWEIPSTVGNSTIEAVKRSSISLIDNSEADHILDDGSYMGLRSISHAIVSYEDTRFDNVLPNGSFDETDGGSILYWKVSSGTAGIDVGVPLNVRGEGNSLRIDNNFDNSPELTAELSIVSLQSQDGNTGLPIDTNVLFKDIEWGFTFSTIAGFSIEDDREGDFIDWNIEKGLEVSFRFTGLNKTGSKSDLYLNSFGYWVDRVSRIQIDRQVHIITSSLRIQWFFTPLLSTTADGDVFEARLYKSGSLSPQTVSINMPTGLSLSDAMSYISSKLVEEGFSSTSGADYVDVSGLGAGRGVYYNDGSASEYINFSVDNMRLGDVATVKFQSKANQGKTLMPDSGVINQIKDIDNGKLHVSIRIKPDWIISFDDFYLNVDNSNDVYEVTDKGSNSTEEYTLGISSSFSGFMDSSVGHDWSTTDRSMYFNDGSFTGTLTELYGAFAVAWRKKALKIFSGSVNGDLSGVKIINIHGERYYILSSDYNADKNVSKIKASLAQSLDYTNIESGVYSAGNNGGNGSGGGNGGSGGGGGGIIQDLQSVLEVGGYATIGGNVSHWIVRDRLTIPDKSTNTPNSIWLGAGITAGDVSDKLVDLGDVSIVQPLLDKQAIVWSEALGKFTNGQGGGSEYVLPIASANTLGGVRIGNGLTINPTTGVLSANITSLDWSNITNKPTTFPPSAHTHPISQVVGLQTALDGKANSTVTITGVGGLTGGGNLTANRTLDLSAVTKSDIAKGVLAESWGDFRVFGLGRYALDKSITDAGIQMATIFRTLDSGHVGSVISMPYDSAGTGGRANLFRVHAGTAYISSGVVEAGEIPQWYNIWTSNNLRSNTQNDARYVLKSGDTMTGELFGNTVQGTNLAGRDNSALSLISDTSSTSTYISQTRVRINNSNVTFGTGVLKSGNTPDLSYFAIRAWHNDRTVNGVDADFRFYGDGRFLSTSIQATNTLIIPSTSSTENNSIWFGAGVTAVQPDDYILPIASATVLGGIKVGANLTISPDGVLSAVGSGSGSVTSVGLSAPTGFVVSGSPVTSSGTLGLSFASGYSLPTTAKQGQWDTAYTQRHTHSNKTVLDGITASDITSWNANINQAQGDARYALRTITISGTGGLTGGGNLTANRTLDLSAVTKSDIAKGVLAESWGDFRVFGLGRYALDKSINDAGIQMATIFRTLDSGHVGSVISMPYDSAGTGGRANLFRVHAGTAYISSGVVEAGEIPQWYNIWTSNNLRSNTQNDARYVQLGNVNQTIQGIKTFSGELRIPSTAGTGNNSIWFGAGVTAVSPDDVVTVFTTTSTVNRAYLNSNYGTKSTGFLCMNTNTGNTYIKTGADTWRMVTSTVVN